MMHSISIVIAHLISATHVVGRSTLNNWTGPSSMQSSTSSACPGCNVVAEEFFLSYPYSVSTITTPVTLLAVPYVTIGVDGSRETNWRTETIGPDGSTLVDVPLEPTPTQPLTWEPFIGVTLTYPTTYANYPSPYGGLDVPSGGVCLTNSAPLALPTNSEQGLIYPVTVSNWDTNVPWNVPQALLDYLDSLPAVSAQFNGTKIGKCVWDTYVTPTTTPVLPVYKLTVQSFTAATAKQAVILTPQFNQGSSSTKTPSPLPQPTAFTRNIQSTASSTPTLPSALPTSGGSPKPPTFTAATIVTILLGSSTILLGGSTVVKPVFATRSLPVSVTTLPNGLHSTVILDPNGSGTVTLGSNGLYTGPFYTGSSYTGPVFTGRASVLDSGSLAWMLCALCAVAYFTG